MGAFIGVVFLLWRSTISLREWQVTFLAFSTIAVYYFAVWPAIVRLKPWTPFQYWLPKSRFIGYFVYLLLPLGILVLLFFLAVKFKVGL